MAAQAPGPTRYTDLTYFYLTPAVGVGQRLALATIDQRLAGLPLWPTMMLLPQIAFRADQISPLDRAGQVEFAQQLLPASMVDRAVGALAHPQSVVVSSQTVLNLAVRAVVHCQESETDSQLDIEVLARQLGGLLLALGDHMSRGDTGYDSLALELVRAELFFRTNDLTAWYEIADRLFFEVMPAMTDDEDFIDVDGVIQTTYEMDFEFFWALTTAYGIAARYDPEHYRVPANFAERPISPDVLGRWCNAWFIDVDDARDLAINDVASGSWWAFSAFFDRPVLRTSGTTGVVVRPAFLAIKATPPGMFWAIRNAFVEQGGEHRRFSAFFGRAVERLGRCLVDEYLSDVAVLRDECAIRTRWSGEASKTCDLVLLGESWIGIDFVYRQFTRDTAATGGIDDLVRDVSRGATEKVVQIDETFARGLEVEPVGPQALYPVVVVGGPFPMNKRIAEEVVAGLRRANAKVVGVNPACRPPAIMDLSEFHVLLQVSHATGATVTEILDDWFASRLDSANFRNWLTTDGPGRGLPGGGAISCRWQQRLQRRGLG